MALIDTPEAAMRLARAITSDISAYNEQKIIRGLQNDSLFEELAAELDEGMNLYRSRVSPDLLESSNFFNLAVVDKIIKPRGHIQSKIW
jgi:ATP-dependent exoDNAse (exonuclease V) beta subunit